MILVMGILFAVFVTTMVWYLGTVTAESRQVKERTEKALKMNASSMDKSDVVKASFSARRSPLRRMFEFAAVPTPMQFILFGLVNLGVYYVLYVKVIVPPTMKLIFSIGAFFVTFRFLKKAAETHRINRMRKELPGTIDLLVICLEAGLGVSSAFLRVANELEGSPLGVELKQTFNEVNAGIPLDTALKNFARRTSIPEVNAIVVSIIQAQKMGSSLAKTFRVQAESLREQFKMKTKEDIMKLPIKIIFPLVFFIFPALFIVILGPAFLSILKQFGTGK